MVKTEGKQTYKMDLWRVFMLYIYKECNFEKDGWKHDVWFLYDKQI